MIDGEHLLTGLSCGLCCALSFMAIAGLAVWMFVRREEDDAKESVLHDSDLSRLLKPTMVPLESGEGELPLTEETTERVPKPEERE